MKAIVQEGSGSADALHLPEVDMPALPDDGVLVRVHAASVNASDWHLLQGGVLVGIVGRLMGARISPVKGGDVAGVVEQVGEAVTRFVPGDQVFGVGAGSFAQYVVAPESRLAEKPSRLSFEAAAAVPGAGCTALQGLRDHGCVRAGQRVLVYGAGGGVGTFAVQIANALGATVTAVTGTPNIDVVRLLGAAEVIDYMGEDVTMRNERYDVVFDVAATRPVADLLGIVSHGGTYVMVGAAKGGVAAILKRMIALQLQSRRLHCKAKTFLARVNAEDLEVFEGTHCSRHSTARYRQDVPA